MTTRAVEAAGQCFQELFRERSCLPMPSLRRVGQPHGNSPDGVPKWDLPPHPLKPPFDVPADSGQGGLVHAIFPPRHSLFAASVVSGCIRFVEAARAVVGSARRRFTWPSSHKDQPEHVIVTPRRERRTPWSNSKTGRSPGRCHTGRRHSVSMVGPPDRGSKSVPDCVFTLARRNSTTETPGTTSHGAFHG